MYGTYCTYDRASFTVDFEELNFHSMASLMNSSHEMKWEISLHTNHDQICSIKIYTEKGLT